MLVEWLFALLGVLVLLHIAVVVYSLRQRGPYVGAPDADTTQLWSPRGDLPEDAVECPDCGETNEPEFRYCRQCVSELPTGVSVLDSAPNRQSRRTL